MKKNNLLILDHPLSQHKLTLIRNRGTSPQIFRNLLHEMSLLLIAEAAKDLMTEKISVETPLMKTTGEKLKYQPIVVAILRAGLSMIDAFLTLMPQALVGYVGLRRNEVTHQAECYYDKIPQISHDAAVFIVDPMLATGGSAIAAINYVKKLGYHEIILVVVIASPEGIQAVHEQHADVKIVTAVVDKGLDKNAFIVPGLGDAGDRFCGTL